MRKFEKLPESKVIFDADVAVLVKSEVPGSESSLTQCLAGEGPGTWVVPYEYAVLILQDTSSTTLEMIIKYTV